MKPTRFDYKKNDNTIVSIDSNEIVSSKTSIKFDGEFYQVVGAYFDMDKDGNTKYVHNCELKQK